MNHVGGYQSDHDRNRELRGVPPGLVKLDAAAQHDMTFRHPPTRLPHSTQSQNTITVGMIPASDGPTPYLTTTRHWRSRRKFLVR